MLHFMRIHTGASGTVLFSGSPSKSQAQLYNTETLKKYALQQDKCQVKNGLETDWWICYAVHQLHDILSLDAFSTLDMAQRQNNSRYNKPGCSYLGSKCDKMTIFLTLDAEQRRETGQWRVLMCQPALAQVAILPEGAGVLTSIMVPLWGVGTHSVKILQNSSRHWTKNPPP